MARTGRPSLLNKQLKETAVRLAKEKGMTLTKMAALLGISYKSLWLYFQQDEDFCKHVEKALTVADDLVEISLFRSACGYSHVDEKIFCTPSGQIKRAKTIRHYPPNFKSMAMWLTNKRPESWRNKVDDDTDAEKPIVIAVDEQNL